MTQALLQRQFINDAGGKPIAVILPIEEYILLRPALEQSALDVQRKVAEMELAATDPVFLADLADTMNAFAATDGTAHFAQVT
ncbi:MAG: hypothetical protein K1X65_10070 [Caldilineales bacterium]|nr:hypothetical protein [Caldilineales bacterium]